MLSLPFCDYLDPIVDTDEQWHELVDPLVARGLPFQIRVIDAVPPRDDPRFVEVDEMAWHVTDLEQTEEALFASWSPASPPERAHRAQSARSRPASAPTSKMCAPFTTSTAVRGRTSTGCWRSRLVLREHLEAVLTRRRIVVGLAEHEGDVIAGSFYLLWGGVWYYKFGASIFERSSVRPNELLAWDSMCVAKSRGCRSYDWGVSDLDPPGLVEYKRKLGTVERPVFVLRCTPDGYTNPAAAEAMPVLGELTGLLTRDDVPDDVTQRAGEILYRYFT